MPKTLLLTDIPPCSNLTAGIVTAQICRAVPREDLSAFIILNPELNPELYPDLSDIPMRIIDKPKETRNPIFLGKNRGGLGAWINETRSRFHQIPPVIKRAVTYGCERNVDQIWAVLQGQTMIRSARLVAEGLNVPLRCSIWDPFDWWLRAWKVDPINSMIDRRLYVKTIRASRCIAAPSWAMADHIKKTYGVDSLPVIRAMEDQDICSPASFFRTSRELVIGMAGQFYAPKEWVAFCRALERADWHIGDRQVQLRIYGNFIPPNQIPSDRIHFAGWVHPAELTLRMHAECDLLYCPYPMSEDMSDVAKWSFPSKLVNYFSAGRPVFFHGPEYSSAFLYVRDNEAGIVCCSFDADEITQKLKQLSEPDTYPEMTSAGHRLVMRDFVASVQRAAARKFLGYSD